MTVLAEKIQIQVLKAAIKAGVREFCICPGARNACFIKILRNQKALKTYYFYDERSAGFFALGKSRLSNRPVAVVTTSGTAVAHLLPAAMEAYYTSIPLLLITADRPKKYRGCNTPQSCEQHDIYGLYTPFSLDLDKEQTCDLSLWDQKSPAHLNVCLEESDLFENYERVLFDSFPHQEPKFEGSSAIKEAAIELENFLHATKNPLVILGSLKQEARSSVANFLKNLNAPVIAEAQSGLRECSTLKRITRSEQLWKQAESAGYAIDGVLRIGGVPTIRLWRDLENREGQIKVLSLNEVPFSGLSWGKSFGLDLARFFSQLNLSFSFSKNQAEIWLKRDKEYQKKLQALIENEPRSEPALVHLLSKKISNNALVYLGNSLPIREWDLAASFEIPHANIHTNRGMNGIDGQTSTFLGLCHSDQENWALLGDLTALHDLSAPWILPQINSPKVQIVIINNKGGKIFSRMFAEPEIQNNHEMVFSSFASLWRMQYMCWESIPNQIACSQPSIIELIPNNEATHRFWKELEKI